MEVATTNLETSSPIRKEASWVAAPASRGQIEITQTSGMNEVTVRISADRTTSSRWITTVRKLRESAVTIRPKVLTCGPEPAPWETASLTATLCSRTLLRLVKSGVHVVASSAEYPATYLRAAKPT